MHSRFWFCYQNLTHIIGESVTEAYLEPSRISTMELFSVSCLFYGWGLRKKTLLWFKLKVTSFCVCSWQIWQKEVIFYLSVLVAPKFISQEPTTEYKLETGQKVTLDCSASGIPKPNVTWNRTNSKGEDDPITDKDIIYTNVGLLIINEVKVSDVGVYQCRVQSLAGVIYRTITIKKIVGKMIFIFFSKTRI